jgi:hypothetical protein
MALVLISTAYQAGHPTTSLPIITVTDPLVGSLIGISVFGERLMIGGVRSPLILIALAITFAGLVNLSRNSRLANEVAGTGRSQPVQPAPPSPRAVKQA